jgi:hypothetical protein
VLPTCPACKQSVLDDDAVECPFCGANMKTGKGAKSAPSGGSAPAKSKPKTIEPTPAPNKPAASSPKGRPARSASTFDDDDNDPFAVAEDDPFTAAAKEEAANKANAIPVMPRKGKLNNIEIKCPMCETVGFVPETAAGKDVKCCNPKCTMPNFMAPKRLAAPIPAASPTPVKKKSTNSKMPVIMALLGGVALVAITGAVFYFMPNGTGSDAETAENKALRELLDKAKNNPKPPKVEKPTETDSIPKGDPAEVAEVAIPPGPDVSKLLNLMHLLSAEEESDLNKSKCRRLVAVGNAVMNDAAAMTQQFGMLDKFAKDQPEMKVPALLVSAWHQLEAGDKASALKTAEQCRSMFGTSSRETQEPVLDLASLFVALGQLKEAQQLLTSKLPGDQNTPLNVALALARDRKDFDLTKDIPGTTPALSRSWPELGVTLILAVRGRWTESRQWAESVSGVEDRTDCLLAWADAKTRSALAAKAAVDPSIEEVGAKFTPGAKLELLGRLALTHANAGNKAEAERLVKAAQDVLKSITVPPAARCENFRQILDWQTPEMLPLRQAMLGGALLGQAQGRLGNAESGWNSTLQALAFARAMAPSPAAVAVVETRIEKLGQSNLKDQVRALLKLRSNDEAQKRAGDLTENLRKLHAQSATRYQLQESVLIGAVHAGMAPLVWVDVLSLSQRSDPNEMEPFLFGVLAYHLRSQLAKDGKQDELNELESKLKGSGELPPDEAYDMQSLVDASLSSAKFKDVINAANQIRLTSATEAVILKSFIEAVKKEPELGVTTLRYIVSLDLKANSQLNMVKLEGLRMASAYAARHGKANEVKDLLQPLTMTPLEKISAYLGLIEGNAIWRREHAPAPVAAPVAK